MRSPHFYGQYAVLCSVCLLLALHNLFTTRDPKIRTVLLRPVGRVVKEICARPPTTDGLDGRVHRIMTMSPGCRRR